MQRESYITLSKIFFGISFLIYLYLFAAGVAAIAGVIPMQDAVSRWSILPLTILFFAAGSIFGVLGTIKTCKEKRQSPHKGYSYNQYRNNYGKLNSNGQFTDDLTIQQFMQFMNEMNRQQQQRFTDDMNMQQQQQFTDEMNRQQQQFMDEMNRQQQQQFMDQSMEESMRIVTPFEQGGYDMNQGNSFNDFNNSNNGF